MHTLKTQETLKEDVLSIVESRIQYVKRQQSQIFQSQHPHLTPGIPSAITDEATANTVQLLLSRFEQLSHIVRLLMVMSAHVESQNAAFALELLTNNKYLSYSVENLRETLNHSKASNILKARTA